MKSSKHFKEYELKCRCGCEFPGMVDGFMEKLELMREDIGKPLTLSSAYRCPEHNDNVSGTGRDGPHTTGRAVDILCSGVLASEVLEAATIAGMTGYGIKQNGPHHKRFIHVDDLKEGTRPWVWSY